MSADEPVLAPPPGFMRVNVLGEFSNHNGPIFRRPAADGDQGIAQAFYIVGRHTNGLGVLHGGMLSTFLDSLLGGSVRQATGRWAVTVHLSIDFLRMARRGEWLLGEGRLTHLAGETAFAEGRAYIGERTVGRATGVFKLTRRQP